MTLCIVGFDDLVTSFVATIATGWSDPCRVGLSPTGKPRLYTAHSAILGYNRLAERFDATPEHDPLLSWVTLD
jgi:hypothetical protein